MQTQCKRCVMDGSATEIVFTDTGCNFCDTAVKQEKIRLSEIKNHRKVIDAIKKAGKGKKYDCLLGLSGGVDSSTCLMKLVENGIRPLCFSLDNGWNDPKADANVERLVKKAGVTHINHKIDLEKFKELQTAFLRGGIKNVEATTDHILFALTYKMIVDNKLKYVISGGNQATESIMPASWGEDARDLYWIKSVYKAIIGRKLTGLPTISLLREQYYRLFKKFKTINLLDYYTYDREEAIKKLQEWCGYEPYGEKHCESVWTHWFQNYYLFEKWGIDKRKAHLSSLIMSGQMTRDEALHEISKCPVYPELGIEQKVMRYPKRSYDDYPNSRKVRRLVSKLYRYAKLLVS
ncbi:N-acetyl sugar amidotransferase [Candidatus Woesearchaeota archaeon]|nr:N-acetyl sugar amidotransferase [Candidatus Woesearchaeota archaeon]